MQCEGCGKPATFKDPVHVVAGSDGAAVTDYMLICDACIQSPEKWVPRDWDKIVDNLGKEWWERK